MKPPHAGWLIVGALALLVAVTSWATMRVATRLYESARIHAYNDALLELNILQRAQDRCAHGNVRCVYLSWPVDTVKGHPKP